MTPLPPSKLKQPSAGLSKSARTQHELAKVRKRLSLLEASTGKESELTTLRMLKQYVESLEHQLDTLSETCRMQQKQLKTIAKEYGPDSPVILTENLPGPKRKNEGLVWNQVLVMASKISGLNKENKNLQQALKEKSRELEKSQRKHERLLSKLEHWKELHPEMEMGLDDGDSSNSGSHVEDGSHGNEDTSRASEDNDPKTHIQQQQTATTTIPGKELPDQPQEEQVRQPKEAPKVKSPSAKEETADATPKKDNTFQSNSEETHRDKADKSSAASEPSSTSDHTKPRFIPIVVETVESDSDDDSTLGQSLRDPSPLAFRQGDVQEESESSIAFQSSSTPARARRPRKSLDVLPSEDESDEARDELGPLPNNPFDSSANIDEFSVSSEDSHAYSLSEMQEYLEQLAHPVVSSPVHEHSEDISDDATATTDARLEILENMGRFGRFRDKFFRRLHRHDKTSQLAKAMGEGEKKEPDDGVWC
eukprot:Nitzschia sp. Nitz4//scaffold81_size91200//13467//14903//NITZ4_004975-RA/size91200-processed-gene-0.117-mRNA-1//-1//CDS//3329558677//4770//frame0